MVTLQFGTSDKMKVIKLEGDKIQLEFVAANRFDAPNQVLVLTKAPVQLVNALATTLKEKESIPEFEGENYHGRAVCFNNDDFALTFEFPSSKPIGYLLHLSKQEAQDFIMLAGALPISPHPTD